MTEMHGISSSTLGAEPLHQRSARSKHPRAPGERKDFHQKMFKTPKETVTAIQAAAVKKSLQPIDVIFLLGIVSGFYIGFGGMFALSVANGLPNSDPGVRKLLNGLLFSCALIFIVITGGELFTGNTMYMMVGVYSRQISLRALLISWVVSFTGNLIGTLLCAYFFGYLTDLFVAEPWLTPLRAIAVLKVEQLGIGVLFLRAIAANWLVCVAIFIGVAAEDIASKILGCMLPIVAFSATGFEHIIANFFYCSLSLMYGADTTAARFVYRNVLIVLLGSIFSHRYLDSCFCLTVIDIIGGGICAGFTLWWSYRFSIREDKKRPTIYFSWNMPADKDDSAV